MTNPLHEITLRYSPFIWWDGDPNRLPPQVLALCKDRTNTILLSVATAWEMQIKFQLGKLKLPLPLGQLIESQAQNNGIQILSITLSHVLALENILPHHKDPFDRLLIAQAITEDAMLLSNDPFFSKYPVKVVWQNPPE